MRHRIVSPVTCAGQDERDIILAIEGCFEVPESASRDAQTRSREFERTFDLRRHRIEVIYFI
jgi:hypothetical protein